MTIKLYEAVTLHNLFTKFQNLRLPFKTSHKIALMSSELSTHYSFYETKFRELINEYGKKDEEGNLMPTADGNGVLLMEDKISEANSKMTELADVEVTLKDYQFSVDDFGDTEMTPAEMNALLPFISE